MLHLVFYSESSVASSHPLLAMDLCLGNMFTELYLGTAKSVGAAGWTEVHLNVGMVGISVFFEQTVEFLGGAPFPVSNCQSILVFP